MVEESKTITVTVPDDEASSTAAETATASEASDQEWRNHKPGSALASLDASIKAFKDRMDEMTRAMVKNLFGGGFEDPEHYKS